MPARAPPAADLENAGLSYKPNDERYRWLGAPRLREERSYVLLKD